MDKIDISLFNDLNYNFLDLVDINKWQRFQDSLSTINNIGLRTLDTHGRDYTIPSGIPRLCCGLLDDPFNKNKFCQECLPTFLGGAKVVDKNLSYECFSGLRSFIAPLGLNGLVLSYVILGPVSLVALKPKQEYRKQAEEFNIELDEYWNLFSEINVVSFHLAKTLIELTKDMGDYILRLSYECKVRERKKMVTEAIKLNKFLDSLLDAAFSVTNADTGSIMLLDRVTDELTVKVSKGLSIDVARNAKVKLGEGISGLAVKVGEAFIIDEYQQDNRIKKYLKRPSIGSSMVIPIKFENDVLGVMNLSAHQSSRIKFDSSKARVINKLIDLAATVFGA